MTDEMTSYVSYAARKLALSELTDAVLDDLQSFYQSDPFCKGKFATSIAIVAINKERARRRGYLDKDGN